MYRIDFVETVARAAYEAFQEHWPRQLLDWEQLPDEALLAGFEAVNAGLAVTEEALDELKATREARGEHEDAPRASRALDYDRILDRMAGQLADALTGPGVPSSETYGACLETIPALLALEKARALAAQAR